MKTYALIDVDAKIVAVTPDFVGIVSNPLNESGQYYVVRFNNGTDLEVGDTVQNIDEVLDSFKVFEFRK